MNTTDRTIRLSIDLSPIMMAALTRRSDSDHQSKAAIMRTALRVELGEEIRMVLEERGKITAPEVSDSGD